MRSAVIICSPLPHSLPTAAKVWVCLGLLQPVPGGLTVNVGDMCCVASNGIVEPCLHRVVSPHTDRVRYSVVSPVRRERGASELPMGAV